MVARRLTNLRTRATSIGPRSFARLWPLGVLVGLAIAVGLFEGSATWRGLDSGLRSLDFDPERALLIEAWLAGALFAFGAALITGRPWLSSGAAVGFVGLTYVLPLGARLVQQAPTLFGMPERVSNGAIQHNQLIALAMAFLVAVVAAAVADLLGREVRRYLRHRFSGAQVLRSGVLAAALVLAIALASGVDPLLRIGPDAGVYTPATVSDRSVSTSGLPQPPQRIPTAGVVRSATYESAAMGEQRQFFIYLPPSYGLRSAAQRQYPTLYLLHGDPSNPTEWLHYGTPAMFDAGLAHGDLPEVILVLPDGNGHATAATQWANSRDGKDRVEDALLELVAHVDGHYRTAADRQYRVIAGLSSGAYGAVNIAARHPDLFSVAMGFSGYYVARGRVFGVDRAYADSNSPTLVVQRSAPARTVHYVVTVGATDVLRGYTEQFVVQLRRLGVPTDYKIIQGGGHSGRLFWEGLLFGLSVTRAQLAAVPARSSSLP